MSEVQDVVPGPLYRQWDLHGDFKADEFLICYSKTILLKVVYFNEDFLSVVMISKKMLQWYCEPRSSLLVIHQPRAIRFSKTLFGAVCSIILGISGSLRAEDWPQWMGPNRDGISRETGLIDSIPEQGLPVLWRVSIGGGYSGPAVSDGRVFVTDYVAANPEVKNDPGVRDVRTGVERTVCLDFANGRELWKVETYRPYRISYAAGPRATPTVDGDRVYVLGAEGDLHCLQAANGQILWHRKLAQEFEAETPLWGHAAHPLVYGNLLYCLAGGENSVVVALDKMSGQTVWSALTASEIGYCPPSLIEIGGKQQLLIWHADAICGMELESGEKLWEYPLKPKYGMSIAIPRFHGNQMFASGIGDTAAMVVFDESGQPSKTLWEGRPKTAVYSANATPLWLEDAIYGADCQTGQFIALDPETGSRYWESFSLTTGGDRRASHGTAFVIQNEWRSFVFAETGELILAKLSKTGAEELGRMQLLEATGECFGRPVVWSHPALANRCMIARNDREIVCVSLAK